MQSIDSFSDSRARWLNSLKPGDKVLTHYPDNELKMATVDYVWRDETYQSNYSVKLKQYNMRLDSFWVHPLF